MSLYFQKPKHRRRNNQNHYGRTSLKPEETSAERLLALKRAYWSIKNKSHWMRNTLLGEGTSTVRTGAIQRVMAALRNAALVVSRSDGITSIAEKILCFKTFTCT